MMCQALCQELELLPHQEPPPSKHGGYHFLALYLYMLRRVYLTHSSHSLPLVRTVSFPFFMYVWSLQWLQSILSINVPSCIEPFPH